MRFLVIAKLLFCLILAFNGCSNGRDKLALEKREYLEQLIKDRIQILNALPADSIPEKPDVSGLDKRVNELILISRDVENLQASVNLANDFFADLAERYKLSSADFTRLNSGMHVNEIESVMKQNELSFLNQYILRFSSQPLPLHTAH